MSLKAKRQYLLAIIERYKLASKKDKGLILDEFCAVCRYHRKSAMRLLNNYALACKTFNKKPGRKPNYTDQEIHILKEIWFLTGKICSKRLKSALPEWIEFYRKETYDHNQYDRLLQISSSTIDRKLKKIKDQDKKGRSTTKKSNWWYRTRIPIRADNDGIKEPGFIQSDTVAHCGTTLKGEFAHTVTCTDVLTTWTETHAIWRKKLLGITDAFLNIEGRFPFPFTILKSDSGCEFMNERVFTFLTCRDFPIDMVRSRPYQKNDQCYVEQKNFTHVRSIFGYIRIDHIELVEKMNEIYVNYWNPLQNFFIPTMKLRTKEKIESKWNKSYDEPKTPFQRVMECSSVSEEIKEKLRTKKSKLNPIRLKFELETKLKEFFDLTKKLSSAEQEQFTA